MVTMRSTVALLGIVATLFMSGAAASEDRDLKETIVAANISIRSFDVTLISTGRPNIECSPDEIFTVKQVIKGALEELGATQLGLASDPESKFIVVDLILDSEIVTDASELDPARRRLAGKWVYRAAATCYLCNNDDGDHRRLKFHKTKKVATGIVVPYESITVIEDMIRAFFGKDTDHCMAAETFKVAVDFYNLE